LATLDAGYRRTAMTVGHKQDPAKAARAEKVLDGWKKSYGGPAEAVLPRRVRLRADPAGRLQLVPSRRTQAGPL
jgi:hypothetical protein